MTIHRYEKVFLWATITLLAVMLVAIFYAAGPHGIHVPDVVGRVDPQTLRSTPPFDAPGLSQLGPLEYHATMVASVWAFAPNEIQVPVGSRVTFNVATPDVIHGFRILGTDINVMVIPGEIARMTHTFNRTGEYTLVCYEYCGVGHQNMHAKIVVSDDVASAPMSLQRALASLGVTR